MRTLLVCSFLLSVVIGQTYLRSTTYVSAGCTGNKLVVRATLTTCTPGVVVACSNGVLQDCVTGVPSQFENAVSLTTFPTNTCSGNPSELLSFVNGICVQFLGTSYTVGCSGGFLTVIYFVNTNVCLGQGYYTQVAGGQCLATPANIVNMTLNNSPFTFATCTATCFHESTEITYNDRETITMQSALAGEHSNDCHVPHVMQANGVKVETSCNAKPLRLTNDHLVYTTTGLRRASSLVNGDGLFSDVDQQHQCIVKEVKGEYNQKYFGLNCRKSDVLADGVKTSTFGIRHTIPAAWMKYGSVILGVERASRWGDKIVSVLDHMNLI